uniref:Uncharacterized protein n=1 Tax=Leptocylindrus danicus TaxID=163516 RepID=A0A7S2NRF0_9STRA
MFKKIVLATLLASAAAFAPSATFGVRTNTALSFEYGEFDDELWDNEAKKVVYEKWDPNSPRTTRNFNPFETFKGNSPDASGIYPGEARYKDPKRGDVSYAIMMVEKADIDDMTANPKAGSEPGCAGCKS